MEIGRGDGEIHPYPYLVDFQNPIPHWTKEESTEIVLITGPERSLLIPNIFKDFLSFFLRQVSKRYVSKEVANTIHEKAKPFIDWLKTAEEESSEEEEDEVEVVYSTKPAPAQEEAKPEEDDINIDDI